MGMTRRAAGRRFDRDHGVVTQALLFLGELGSERGEAYAHATHYEPVPVADFHALMRSVPKAFVHASTFVDVGAGMGRAVLLAREYPFKQVVGIELAPHLFEIARENLARGHGFDVACKDARLIRADARKRKMPRGGLVVFLYNPFDAEALDAVLDRIADRGDREVFFLYHTPVHADRLTQRGYEALATLSCGAAYRVCEPSINAAISGASIAGEK
ncbi:MAG TPA: class I SAM-dependent methyltransferase [Candidatus Baltobacteraceae bacterium]|nr:class I SAM-dependent methyltransferase [Candidatus Baltobacteraceae bacterium]